MASDKPLSEAELKHAEELLAQVFGSEVASLFGRALKELRAFRARGKAAA